MKKIFYFIFTFAAINFASCDDLLNDLDNTGGIEGTTGGNDTTEVFFNIDTLVTYFTEFYPQANYAYVSEMLSDNIVDNNSPNLSCNQKDKLVSYNLEPFNNWNEKIFFFLPTDTLMYDSEEHIYNKFHFSCEQAGLFIYAVENIPDSTITKYGETMLKSMQGEAYVLRSFSNFILENLFAQSYVTGRNTKAMPYCFYPDKNEECSVEQAYEYMQEDLAKGIELLNKYGYPESKFRFNKEAVYAYATRLNTYMRRYSEAIHFADMALGTGNAAAAKMRNFNNFTQNLETMNDFVNVWHNEEEPSVFMMNYTYSTMFRAYLSSARYAFNASAVLGTTQFSPTCNLSIPPYWLASGLYANGSNDYGMVNCKIGETFVYTDEEAGIGYPVLKKIEFSAEETLLCRAEAKLFSGDFNGALEDMIIWDNSKRNFKYDIFGDGNDNVNTYYKDLSLNGIKDFYKENSRYDCIQSWKSCYFDGTPMSDMLSNFTILGYNLKNEDEIAVMRYILHSRRLETVFDGLRFFDLKRFGIEYQHSFGINGDAPANIIELKYDDPRRALRFDFIENKEDTVSSKGYITKKTAVYKPIDVATIRIIDHLNTAK